MPKSYEEQLDEMITPMRGVGRRSILVTDEEYAAHMKNKAAAESKKGGSMAGAKKKTKAASQTAGKSQKAVSKSLAHPTLKTGGKPPMFMN